MKVLVNKSFKFVERIWQQYVTNNMEDLRPLDEITEDDTTDDELAEDGCLMDDDDDIDGDD